jgi:anti-anti-sigma factor
MTMRHKGRESDMNATKQKKVRIFPLEMSQLFDDTTVSEILREIDQILTPGSAQTLVLDFAQVTMAGTPALRMLVRLRTKCTQAGCELAICGVQPAVREVLQLTNLDQIFRIYPDVEATVAAINPDTPCIA